MSLAIAMDSTFTVEFRVCSNSNAEDDAAHPVDVIQAELHALLDRVRSKQDPKHDITVVEYVSKRKFEDDSDADDADERPTKRVIHRLPENIVEAQDARSSDDNDISATPTAFLANDSTESSRSDGDESEQTATERIMHRLPEDNNNANDARSSDHDMSDAQTDLPAIQNTETNVSANTGGYNLDFLTSEHEEHDLLAFDSADFDPLVTAALVLLDGRGDLSAPNAVQQDYGCTCNRCLGGFLSPRMTSIIEKEAEIQYDCTNDAIDIDAAEWESILMDTSFLSEQALKRFNFDTCMRIGFRNICGHLRSCLRHGRVPNEANILEEIHAANEFPPQSMHFLQCEGTIASVVFIAFNLALRNAEEDSESDSDDSDDGFDSGLPHCHNDTDLILAFERCGFGAWGLNDNDNRA